ncbi:hypothetical protein PCE1_002495 [Barthelona sp. PCE]
MTNLRDRPLTIAELQVLHDYGLSRFECHFFKLLFHTNRVSFDIGPIKSVICKYFDSERLSAIAQHLRSSPIVEFCNYDDEIADDLDRLVKKHITRFLHSFYDIKDERAHGFRLFLAIKNEQQMPNQFVIPELLLLLCLIQHFPRLAKSSVRDNRFASLGVPFLSFYCSILAPLPVEVVEDAFKRVYSSEIFEKCYKICVSIMNENSFSLDGAILIDKPKQQIRAAKMEVEPQKETNLIDAFFAQPTKKKNVEVIQSVINKKAISAAVERLPGYTRFMEFRSIERISFICIALFNSTKCLPEINRQTKQALHDGLAELMGNTFVKDLMSYSQQALIDHITKLRNSPLTQEINTVARMIAGGLFKFDYPSHIAEPLAVIHERKNSSDRYLPDFYVFGALSRTYTVNKVLLKRIKYKRLEFFLQFSFPQKIFKNFHQIHPSVLVDFNYVPMPNYVSEERHNDDAVLKVSKSKAKPKKKKKKTNVVEVDDLFITEKQSPTHKQTNSHKQDMLSEQVASLARTVDTLVATQSVFMQEVSTSLAKMAESLSSMARAMQQQNRSAANTTDDNVAYVARKGLALQKFEFTPHISDDLTTEIQIPDLIDFDPPREPDAIKCLLEPSFHELPPKLVDAAMNAANVRFDLKVVEKDSYSVVINSIFKVLFMEFSFEDVSILVDMVRNYLILTNHLKCAVYFQRLEMDHLMNLNFDESREYDQNTVFWIENMLDDKYPPPHHEHQDFYKGNFISQIILFKEQLKGKCRIPCQCVVYKYLCSIMPKQKIESVIEHIGFIDFFSEYSDKPFALNNFLLNEYREH